MRGWHLHADLLKAGKAADAFTHPCAVPGQTGQWDSGWTPDNYCEYGNLIKLGTSSLNPEHI